MKKLMRKLAIGTLGLASFPLAVNATIANAESFALISGFDDVLRQADNQNLLKAGLKLFERDKTFAGMSELYAGLSENVDDEVKFSLVSGTSSIFHSRVEQFLIDSDYPKARIYLRNWALQWSVEEFKIASIHQVLRDRPGQKFIVIFDNSGPSVDMTTTIPKTFPGQVLHIYLRETVSRPPIDGAQQFITALDIALSEMKAGRLSSARLTAVAQAIISEERPDLILPTYAYCPIDYSPCTQTGIDSVIDACLRVQEKVRSICEGRL